jgi:release factor glutamine methyltransferase
MTPLRDALGAAQLRLVAAGVPEAGGDARKLVAHAAGIAPERLTLSLDSALDDAGAQRLEAMLRARELRQPVSQIIGGRWFWGHWFTVTPDVLDPRPETETLVAAALEVPFTTVLDLGTGSGAILLSLLADRGQSRGLGTDISPAALNVAQRNRAALGLEGRATLRLSDWFSAVSEQFDLIVSNPPYIAAAEMPALAPEVRNWEPLQALTPGGDGLDAYRAIARDARRHLVRGGTLLLEIGPTQGDAVSELLHRAGFDHVNCLRDLDGRARVMRAQAP